MSEAATDDGGTLSIIDQALEVEMTMTDIAPAKLATLRSALITRRRALSEEIRAELAASGDRHYIDLAGRVHDAGEESIADLLADLDAARVDRHVTELREIEAALSRLEDGSYGRCGDCGLDIGIARLEVQPAARRCVPCQSRHEHGHGGMPSL